jgi:hypothetical protein
MQITRKTIIGGALAVGIVAITGIGAFAVSSSLAVNDQPGQVQNVDPVLTGDDSTSTPSPSVSSTTDPNGTTTVAPAPPTYVDDHGGDRHDGSDDGPNHDLNDDHGGTDDSGGHGGDDDNSGRG